MPPLPVIANVFRVTWKWQISTNPGVNGENVLNFRAVPGPSTPLALFTALDAHTTNNQFAALQANANIFEVDIIPLDGVGATQTFHYTSAKGGSVTGDYTVQTAALLTLRTDFRGPRHRGRLYLPFVGEGGTSDGVLDPTAQATMNTAWQAFVTAMDGAGFPLVVASYKHADANPVTSQLVETVTGTQRRRVDRLR